mmetsp:Transcript_13597/g.22641  ORF Transcript_13597/g.22641 Transcript_13597/m.22641 type:complete len:80 (+) Transcript_13597:1970-2209(+)
MQFFGLLSQDQIPASSLPDNPFPGNCVVPVIVDIAACETTNPWAEIWSLSAAAFKSMDVAGIGSIQCNVPLLCNPLVCQ